MALKGQAAHCNSWIFCHNLVRFPVWTGDGCCKWIQPLNPLSPSPLHSLSCEEGGRRRGQVMTLAALSLLGTLRVQAWSLMCILPVQWVLTGVSSCWADTVQDSYPKDFMVVGLLVNWKIGEFSETNLWNNEHIGLKCKCRFCSVSLGKGGQFTQSPLSMCFVGCDEQSPWWEKHHLFRTCPWLWNFSLSRLLTSIVCSASLQCWFREVTQLENEGAALSRGRQKQNGCR